MEKLEQVKTAVLLAQILSVMDEEKLIRLRKRLEKKGLHETADFIRGEIKRRAASEKEGE